VNYLVDNLYSAKSEEWYTPPEFVKAARQVLGPIELDPASCEIANQVIRAERYYTLEDDGLSQDWRCKTMWCNPPFGRVPGDRTLGKADIWAQRLVREYECGNVGEAILLVHAHTYKQWFRPLCNYLVCFSERLYFWNAQNKSGRSPHGSALFYLGKQPQKFVDVFDQFGPVEQRLYPTPKPAQPTLWDEVSA